MYKTHFLAFCLSVFCGSTAVQAQQSNHSVRLHLLNNYSVCSPDRSIDYHSTLGLSYDYKLSNRLGIGASFSAWTPKRIDLGGDLFPIFPNQEYEQAALEPRSVGKLSARSGYKFLDLHAMAELSPFRKHSFVVKAGPSVANGNNTYYSAIVPPNLSVWPDYCLAITAVETREVNETTLGATAGLSYGYLMWQQRLELGADLGCRAYRNLPMHVNYGVHVGCRF